MTCATPGCKRESCGARVLVDGVRTALCAKCKLERSREYARRYHHEVRKPREAGMPTRADRRRTNGAKFKDLSPYFDRVVGTRTVTGADVVVGEDGKARQKLVLTCTCGATAHYDPSKFDRGVGLCNECAPRKQNRKRHDYDGMIGKVLGGGFRVVAYETTPRPTLTLRCPEGHTFPRLGWEVMAVPVDSARKCPECVGEKSAAKREPDDAEIQAANGQRPEVCPCEWRDGRLRTLCRWCVADRRVA